MKKLLSVLTVCSLGTCLMTWPVKAEEPYSNGEYWNNYCSVSENSVSDECESYRSYLKSQSDELAAELDEIEARKAEYTKDIAMYRDHIAQVQEDIATLESQIADVQTKIEEYQVQIDTKQKEIDAKQVEIDHTQDDIDTISEKIKKRMVTQQASMKINKYLDILMGASTLSDFIRILAGLQSISESDQNSTNELVQLNEKLSKQKSELLAAQEELKQAQAVQETEKANLSAKQADFIVKQADLQAAKEVAEAQEAALEAQGNHISSNIDSIRDTLNSVAAQYGGISTSSEWARPVFGSYRSAGTWNYPSGGVHLGYDFAVGAGTDLFAAGGGVILSSVNGCSTGYLGNQCGYQYGGSYGGGNQIFLLCVVDGGLYGIHYCHMQLNTPIPTGTIVKAGDYVGKTGSTGNSSGPHCHIEVMYLGDGANFSNYAQTWDGDMAFGAGWQGDYDGYGRRCEMGYSAPCRIRPETIWGY